MILTIFQSYPVFFAGIRVSPAECVNITFNNQLADNVRMLITNNQTTAQVWKLVRVL